MFDSDDLYDIFRDAFKLELDDEFEKKLKIYTTNHIQFTGKLEQYNNEYIMLSHKNIIGKKIYDIILIVNINSIQYIQEE